MRFSALVALLAILVPVTPAAAQPVMVEDAADPYVHKSVGVEFPAELGKYRRGRIVEYTPDGSDASVGYSVEGMPAEITLYVYPVRDRDCQGEHDGAREAILSRGGTEREAGEPIGMPGFAAARQLSSVYDIEAGGFGFDHPPLVSYLWLACVPGDQWLVKYRGSFLASDEGRSLGLGEMLLGQIDWSPLGLSQAGSD